MDLAVMRAMMKRRRRNSWTAGGLRVTQALPAFARRGTRIKPPVSPHTMRVGSLRVRTVPPLRGLRRTPLQEIVLRARARERQNPTQLEVRREARETAMQTQRRESKLI